MKQRLLWLGATLVVLLQVFGICSGCIPQEKAALLAFKASLKLANTSHDVLPSWVTEAMSNCCSWERVTCDSTGHVINLSLDDVNRDREGFCLNMTSLNWSLFLSFKELTSLNLAVNCFDGFILDGDLGNLSKLEVLILRDAKLNGPSLIRGLCQMKQLQELDLSLNSFTGTLDECFGNWTSLRALDLSYNSFSGSIPTSSISRMTSLEYLSLSGNNFEGIFSLHTLANHSKLKVLEMDSTTFQLETENPSWIPSFQLEYLHMPNCQVNLPGKFSPTFLSYQHSLRYVDLSRNNLVGMFPNWLLLNNPKLEAAFLYGNSFAGPFKLPSDLNSQMDQLLHLDMSNNKIQGRLPFNIGFFLPNLLFFSVSNNMFDGDIPASIGQMSKLSSLNLAYNNFSGQVPKQILLGGSLLQNVILSNNSLEGEILSTPMNLGFFSILMLDNNKFSGTLPLWVWNKVSVLSVSRNNFEGAITEESCQSHSVFLYFLDLSHNKFSGTIPACFNMPSVKFIHLQGNSFTGRIPDALNSTQLVTIDLRDNKFTGSIPESIYGLQSLKFLLLAGNHLQGQLSSEICQLTNISILDLSRNNFTGSLPSCLKNLPFGKAELVSLTQPFHSLDEVLAQQSIASYEYSNFSLTRDYRMFQYGKEEVQFMTKGLFLSYKGYVLHNISGLDLSSNQLTGEIPPQIGDLIALHALNLSHNHLNGSIPESFHKLESIESLDLSNNKLSGQIPPQLQDLNFLSAFNVSYNNLSGMAPHKGQFGAFDESSYRGNPYLSWSNSNRGIAPPPTPVVDIEKKDSAIDSTAFCWSFAASYVMVLLMLVTILWINPRWRIEWFYFIEGCLLKCFGPFGQCLQHAFY